METQRTLVTNRNSVLGRIKSFTSFALVCFVINSCGTEDDSTTSSNSSDFGAVFSILEADCSQCHNSNSPTFDSNAGLSYADQASAFTALTTGSVSRSGNPCANKPYVTANNTSDSYVSVIASRGAAEAATAAGYGCNAVHASGAYLDDIARSDLNIINNWINAGAPNN